MPKKGMLKEELEKFFTEYELRVVGAYLANRYAKRKDNTLVYGEAKNSKDMLMGIREVVDDEDLIEKFEGLMDAEAKRLLQLVKEDYMPDSYEDDDDDLLSFL